MCGQARKPSPCCKVHLLALAPQATAALWALSIALTCLANTVERCFMAKCILARASWCVAWISSTAPCRAATGTSFKLPPFGPVNPGHCRPDLRKGAFVLGLDVGNTGVVRRNGASKGRSGRPFPLGKVLVFAMVFARSAILLWTC